MKTSDEEEEDAIAGDEDDAGEEDATTDDILLASLFNSSQLLGGGESCLTELRGPQPVLAGVVGRPAEGGKKIKLGVVSNILPQHSPLPAQRPGVMHGATADLVRGDMGYTKDAIPKVRGKVPELADTVEMTTHSVSEP